MDRCKIENSTNSNENSQEQFIMQLIQHNDVEQLKEMGIRTKDWNFVEPYPSVDVDTKITPLICAVYLSKLDIVRLLLENPYTDIDQSSEENGYTPLTISCMTGNFEILCMLLEKGAEVNKPTVYYQTPFICCFQRLEEESNVFENRKICIKMAEYCLNYGSDINWIVDRNKGYTLLMQLISTKMDLSEQEMQINYEIVRFLIENGANTQLKTHKGKSMFELAEKHTNKENIQNLLTNCKQIYFYNQKPTLINKSISNSNNIQSQSQQQQQENQKNKSMMSYLALCKN